MKEEESKVFLPKVDLQSSYLLCYCDASLGNLNGGLNSTSGYIVFLTEQLSGKSCALNWQSKKIQRVVNSTLAAESLALVEGLNATLYTRDLLTDMVGVDKSMIPIRIAIDNKSTVEAVRSSTTVGDKRLLRDIAAIKQLLENDEVESINWVPGYKQLADVLTKRGVNGANMKEVIQTGNLRDFLPYH